MATETVALEKDTNQEMWSGGKAPFKASYGKLMMWYFLLSDAFTFAGFLIAYGALRFSMPTWPLPDFVFSTAPGLEGAPLIFVTFMTFVLIVSSVTMVRAVQEGHRENKQGVVFWMVMTIIGGATFLGCQAWEWNKLIGGEGMTLFTDPFSNHTEDGEYLTGSELEKLGYGRVENGNATYYLAEGAEDIEKNRLFVKKDHHGHNFAEDEKKKKIKAGDPYLITYSHDTHMYEYGAIKTSGGEVTREALGPRAFGALFFSITGFHGFHVFSGVVFLIIITINVASGLYVDRKNGYEMVEKMGLYWHFVDLVWVFVFLVFYLL